MSIETIRRDLLSMEQNDLLKRVHGGAVTTCDMISFHDLNVRNDEHPHEKQEVAEIAMQYIEEGDVIGIDAGSTAISFANTLKKYFAELTVVTHSLDVFNILYRHEKINVLLCGGGTLCKVKMLFMVILRWNLYLDSSDENYILADSSKFEKTALLKVDDMKSEYFYITDSRLPEE